MTNIFDNKSQNLTPSQNLDTIRLVCFQQRFGRSIKLRTGAALYRKMLAKRVENGFYLPTKKAKQLIQYEY